MSWEIPPDAAELLTLEGTVDQLHEKIGRLEAELVDLMCRNESLKTENEMLRRSIDFGAGQKQRYITSTFCGTPEQFEEWRRQFEWREDGVIKI